MPTVGCQNLAETNKVPNSGGGGGGGRGVGLKLGSGMLFILPSCRHSLRARMRGSDVMNTGFVSQLRPGGGGGYCF